MSMKRYWVRWASTCPIEAFEYHGPWWVSGYDHEDRPVVCAAVAAPNEGAAQSAIEASYDTPHEIEFSFVMEKEDDWEPFCGRFRRSEWMQWPWPKWEGA